MAVRSARVILDILSRQSRRAARGSVRAQMPTLFSARQGPAVRTASPRCPSRFDQSDQSRRAGHTCRHRAGGAEGHPGVRIAAVGAKIMRTGDLRRPAARSHLDGRPAHLSAGVHGCVRQDGAKSRDLGGAASRHHTQLLEAEQGCRVVLRDEEMQTSLGSGDCYIQAPS